MKERFSPEAIQAQIDFCTEQEENFNGTPDTIDWHEQLLGWQACQSMHEGQTDKEYDRNLRAIENAECFISNGPLNPQRLYLGLPPTTTEDVGIMRKEIIAKNQEMHPQNFNKD